jgi:hypothetical protein
MAVYAFIHLRARRRFGPGSLSRYHGNVSQAPIEPETTAPPAPPSDQKVRRRVAPEQSEERKGRSGCLLTGAILGVIVGATFAFYGLPPILKHFYGEQHIAVGQTYTGGGKSIRVDAVLAPDPPRFGMEAMPAILVRITVTTDEAWTVKPSDFSLEYGNGGDWVEGLGIAKADPTALRVTTGMAGPPFVFPQSQTGTETQSNIAFPVADAARGAPKYLHLTSPRVRFELPPAATAVPVP